MTKYRIFGSLGQPAAPSAVAKQAGHLLNYAERLARLHADRMARSGASLLTA